MSVVTSTRWGPSQLACIPAWHLHRVCLGNGAKGRKSLSRWGLYGEVGKGTDTVLVYLLKSWPAYGWVLRVFAAALLSLLRVHVCACACNVCMQMSLCACARVCITPMHAITCREQDTATKLRTTSAGGGQEWDKRPAEGGMQCRGSWCAPPFW